MWNNDILIKNVAIYQKLQTDIGKVADSIDFASTINLDIQTCQISNITTNEKDDT